MQSARKAGWDFVGWTLLSGIMFLITRIVSEMVEHIALTSSYVDFISLLVGLLLIKNLYYAMWGLSCGYSQKSWERYCDADRKVPEEGAKRALAINVLFTKMSLR